MKHKDMCNQMGKIVTVFQKYVKTVKGREVRWDIRDCKLWCGWLVGFTYKMDGKVIYGSWEDQTIFKETNRKLCALVKPWPTMREVFVPMTGFEYGGTPEPPDYGGWRNISEETRKRYIEELRKDTKRQPRDEKGRWIKEIKK